MPLPPDGQPVEKEEDFLAQTLRPQTFVEYIGQQKTKDNLSVAIGAAQIRREPLEHVLIHGPAGIGKTTLAYLIAKEMRSSLRVTSGPAIEKVGDLAAILTNLEAGDVLFIDEVHRLSKLIEEILYPAMESRSLDIVLGKGGGARTIQLPLPPFTLIAATTRIGLLSSPLRSRFGSTFRLEFYSEQEIEEILNRSAKILGVSLTPEASKKLAVSSRSTPRVANRLLKRCRDLAQVEKHNIIDEQIVSRALKMLEIDEVGLESSDRKILRVLIEHFNGGPAGIQAIAASSSEEEETILEVFEPYLLRIVFLTRTPRGRAATKAAYRHLGVNFPKKIDDARDHNNESML